MLNIIKNMHKLLTKKVPQPFQYPFPYPWFKPLPQQ